MKIKLLILATLIAVTGFGQNLKTFTVTMQPDGPCYISLTKAKAFTAANASVVKADLDFGMFETASGNAKIIEWYNLKSDNEKVPSAITGTSTKIVAISFDRDQFDKCKTAADLKRMTGYLTSNSLSHFAVIRNNSNYYQRCFIYEKANGKRGLMFVTDTGEGKLKVEVKGE